MTNLRILFCFVGGPGHFEPMVPIARAAQAAGHTVAVACSPGQFPGVEAAGFEALSSGSSAPARKRERRPLEEVDVEREERHMRERFADAAARVRADGVKAIALDWLPDLVVADEANFGAMIAAEQLDLPYAIVLVIAAGTLIRAAVVAETLNCVRADYGLPADPDFTAPSRYLVLSPFPASLRDPAHPLPPTTHFFRSLPPGARDAPDEISTQQRVGAPTVYFTLGTEFNTESGDLFNRAIAGLRQLPIRLIVTVGRDIDPAEFGSQPANVRIEQYLPHAEILRNCDLVVCHGGSGTLIGALSHGLPMVVVAMGADQPANARRCEQLGLGISLDPVRATPEEIRDAAAAVLADPNYLLAAQKVRAEIEAQASPASAVALLEQLATHHLPRMHPSRSPNLL